MKITDNWSKGTHARNGDIRLSSYLKNVVCEGTHIWKFEYNIGTVYGDKWAIIGVWKTKSGNTAIEGVRLYNTKKDGVTCTGYGITMSGYKSNPENVGNWCRGNLEEAEDGDIIEMILNLDIRSNQMIPKFLLVIS